MIRLISLIFLLAQPLWAQQRPQGDPFNNWDRNADGKLTPDEVPESLRQNFSKVDRDGDGFINPQEHAKAVARWRERKQTRGRERPQAPVPDTLRVEKNLDYVGEGNPRQMLDLILPKERAEGKEDLPLIVFIHGGGWRNGSKEGAIRRLGPFVESGNYVGATINYRLTGESGWPTQIHDCKAAIRYLRAHAGEFGINPEKIAVWGSSAGGHLVSMLGTSGGVEELEGVLGGHTDQSSRVSCVVNYFGPGNLVTMVGQKSKVDRSRGKQYPEALLLGGPVQDLEKAAMQASPVTWVSEDDPPFLTVHGTEDAVVPFAQGEEIHTTLQKEKVESHLIHVEGAGHGFSEPEVEKRVKTFFEKHLQDGKVEVSSEPIQARQRR